MSYVIELAKENFKFSCTHFTIFSADRAERLHGHNYQASARFHVDDLMQDIGMAFEFDEAKKEIRSLCEELDEHVLAPGLSPFLKIDSEAGQTNLFFSKRRYSIPTDEIKILPVSNVTVRRACHYFAKRLGSSFSKNARFKSRIRRLCVAIEETRGQSASLKSISRTKLKPKP